MKILHLEDNPCDAELAGDALTAEFPDCAIVMVTSRHDFIDRLATESPDLILSDNSLPAFSGIEALSLAQERAPHIPFVFLSGTIGEERAIAAIRAGAYDYVLKDNTARLPVVIRRALDEFAQRRHHEEDDRRLRELAGVIERAAEAIVVSDMAGRITLWNDGAARLYGVAAAAALGRTAEEVFPSSLRSELRAAREATLEKGDWRREISVTTPDGREVIVDLHMTLVPDAAGRPSARLQIATDITEKKKIEEQFLHTQRLESLGLLAAGIAHDFNNVLAPLVMAAPLLRQHATAPGAVRILDMLEKSTERGVGLVRQILSFARSTSGGFQLTQVKHLLRDVGDVIEATFPKSIVLDLSVPGNLWPIQANPTQIHQILLNLAINARDAMLPRGGTLRLGAENRCLDESTARAFADARPGAYLVLSVADTGTGITPEVLARIWEPFFTTKGEGKGTGLGLSTVRGIAAAHRGFATIETRVNHGSVFRIFLPADGSANEGGAAGTPASAPRGHGELILVVDDEPNVRDLIATILTDHGYHAITCGDGVEAIGQYTQHSAEISMVVSDLNMPNLDGSALALVLQRLRPDLKLLVISGRASRESLSSVDSATFTAKLAKPFTPEALLTAIHRILHAEQSTA